MKRILGKALLGLFNRNRAFRNKIILIVKNYFLGNQAAFSGFFNQFESQLNEELDKFPSVFNQGYLHINKAVAYIKHFQLSKDNLIIDIGAAGGETTSIFAKAFPYSQIYAYEPIQSTFDLLRKKTASYLNVHIFCKAIGYNKGNKQMNIAERITCSSLFEMEKNISNKFFAQNIKNVGTNSIEIDTLDASLPDNCNVNLIKMDVQGYELEILKGGNNTLERTAIILLEMQNHQLYVGAPKYYNLDEYLRTKGFELYDIIPSIRQDKKLYEWDAIYINKQIIP